MKSITVQELQKQLQNPDSTRIVIDVREPFEHTGAHIPGSENMPLDTLSDKIKTLQSYGKVYVSCGSGNRSSKACETLSQQGVEVVNVDGGLSAWQEAGFEVNVVKKTLPLVRQMLIVTGILSIASVALSFSVHPYWILLAGAVGAGQLFAGATGICGMTTVLKYMPWNR